MLTLKSFPNHQGGALCNQGHLTTADNKTLQAARGTQADQMK